MPQRRVFRKKIRMVVNGEPTSVEVENQWTLLDVLRDHLNLTGAKKGCDDGACGACTVIMNSKTVDSCLTLAVEADEANIQTIEGLTQRGELHPLQKAFIEHDALQCGYCTSGQILTAKALLNEITHPTEEEIKKALGGNLCRCGSYNNIVQAVIAAAKILGEK